MTSYIKMPKLHTSVAGDILFSLKYSYEEYRSEKPYTLCDCRVRLFQCSFLESPKSHSLIFCLVTSSSMLAGLRSQCTKLQACSSVNAFKICTSNETLYNKVSVSCTYFRYCFRSTAILSITIYILNFGLFCKHTPNNSTKHSFLAWYFNCSIVCISTSTAFMSSSSKMPSRILTATWEFWKVPW